MIRCLGLTRTGAISVLSSSTCLVPLGSYCSWQLHVVTTQYGVINISRGTSKGQKKWSFSTGHSRTLTEKRIHTPFPFCLFPHPLQGPATRVVFRNVTSCCTFRKMFKDLQMVHKVIDEDAPLPILFHHTSIGTNLNQCKHHVY